MSLLLAAVLNAPSTASAAAPCAQQGLHPGGAHGLLVLRPGHTYLACGSVRIAKGPAYITVPGSSGTLHSRATRIDGLLGVPELRHGDYAGGGHADLPKLKRRLEATRAVRVRVRIVVAAILIALALFAPRRTVTGSAAAISTALLLSAFGSTNVWLLGALTLLGALLPWRALWVFWPTYLAVLVLSPLTQSLALLGPHPWGAGRYYGMSNELETLVLAPALVLGLPAAPLVLLTVGWSRAGSDGGGLLVFLAGYAWLTARPWRAAIAAVAVALAFVGVDALTGGSNHVTHAVLHGGLPHDVWHRWVASWHGATANWGRGLLCVVCLGALAWVAARRPRARVVDAFLIAILVSLVANDTPQDVLFWGAITGVGLRRAV